MRAGIALGSNLGDRLANLVSARRQLCDMAAVAPPVLASSVYETDPIDCEPDAGKFLNAVIEIGYTAEANELMQALRAIEAAHGRPATHRRNASRTLDLDLLYFGELQLSTPQLELPHPRLHLRRFVLEPLAEIRPDLVLPGRRAKVTEMLARVTDCSPLVRIASEW